MSSRTPDQLSFDQLMGLEPETRPHELWIPANNPRVEPLAHTAYTPEQAFHAATTSARRRDLGQFFTPPSIAAAMVRWVAARSPQAILDPAVGPGIFLECLGQCALPSAARVTAIDIDAVALETATARTASASCLHVSFHNSDFLKWPPPSMKYDAIVCNPPYVRHNLAGVSEAVFCQFETKHRLRLSRLTNIYCLFILKILECLDPGGRAAIITPTEYLNADYGRAIKEALLTSGLLAGFVVVDPGQLVFDDALTTATITLLHGRTADTHVRFAGVSDLEDLTRALEWVGGEDLGLPAIPKAVCARVHPSQLDPSRKWANTAHLEQAPASGMTLRPLSEFGRCIRGIATGANSFFTLTQAEADLHGLPQAVLTPCLCKAAHATGVKFAPDDWQRLRAQGKKVFVLNTKNALHPRVAQYLAAGEEQGFHLRFLTRHRRPWYSLESRCPAQILVTVFGRRGLRFLDNQAGVRSLTAFHGIYLQDRYASHIALLMLYFCSPCFERVAHLEHRVYGDGLLKYEPRDVERLLVPDLNLVSEPELQAFDHAYDQWLAAGGLRSALPTDAMAVMSRLVGACQTIQIEQPGPT